jgi:hypothetical protein
VEERGRRKRTASQSTDRAAEDEGVARRLHPHRNYARHGIDPTLLHLDTTSLSHPPHAQR